MKFTISPPKTWVEWTMYLFGVKFIWIFGVWLFNLRPSSNESKKEFTRMGKQIQALQDSQLTKEDFRIILREENKDLATKEELEHVRKELSLEMNSKIDLKFKDMEIMQKESLLLNQASIKNHEQAKTEYRTGKLRHDKQYNEIRIKLEKLNEKRK